MAKTTKLSDEKEIRTYLHSDKMRLNNPPAGYAQYDKEKDKVKKYDYDPNIDPSLVWAGKKERTSFDVPVVSLHVHETINPYTIIKSVKKKGGNYQATLFDTDNLIQRKESLEFYKHQKNWSNRLIAGDSLLVMNSLIEKEGMSGKLQMIYIDPPYGIRYGSNFQPFVDKTNVNDKKDEDLTQEPEMIRAFRDTWELGIHSYLSYLRDRLLLAKELLSESGSVFVQISDENIHHVREICDEIFGKENFVIMISYASTSGFPTNTISRAGDYVVWYAKSIKNLKIRPLFVPKIFGGDGSTLYKKIELADGKRMSISEWEKENGVNFDYDNRPKGSKIYGLDNITSQGSGTTSQPFEYCGKTYYPKKGNHWKANYPEGMQRLKELNRIDCTDNQLGYVRYYDDFPYVKINNMWKDTLGQSQYGDNGKKYVVQTSLQVIQRCMLMSTDPGDLVLDITCGSGTTAYLAEQWGRRWITCDTSRIAISLTKQRLLTSIFNYYTLMYPECGIAGGLCYNKVNHVKLESLANNKPFDTEDLVDQPTVDKTKLRVSGPFTVEAIPSPTVQSIDDIGSSVSETVKQATWRDELLATGIITRAGQKIEFTRVEPLPGAINIQAEGETTDNKKAIVCFSSESHPLDSRMVANVLDEAETIRPSPDLIIFCAFQFDPEAANFIEKQNWPGVSLLKVQMNTDLLTEDLKKNRANNQSFWMIGQPDVVCERITSGSNQGKYVVNVRGFDYYDVKSGAVESGDTKRISMWMLDIDYDGMTLNPEQIFFPMAGSKDGWSKLAKTLKSEVDPELIEMYRGVESIPFSIPGSTKIAVKIIDDRGIESMKILNIEGQK